MSSTSNTESLLADSNEVVQKLRCGFLFLDLLQAVASTLRSEGSCFQAIAHDCHEYASLLDDTPPGDDKSRRRQSLRDFVSDYSAFKNNAAPLGIVSISSVFLVSSRIVVH